MKSYRVKWEIDVSANSHVEAAQKALEIQRDPKSIATCFDVLRDVASDRFVKWVAVDLNALN